MEQGSDSLPNITEILPQGLEKLRITDVSRCYKAGLERDIVDSMKDDKSKQSQSVESQWNSVLPKRGGWTTEWQYSD